MPKTHVAVLLSAAIGCGGCVSLHEMRATEIAVFDLSSNGPVANLPVKVNYWYDSYGVLHVFRQPDPVLGTTDQEGRFAADLATWNHRIWIDLGDKSAVQITAENVRNGGTFKSFPVRNSGVSYWVTLRPRTK